MASMKSKQAAGNNKRNVFSRLNQICAMDIDSDCQALKKTGIICTAGPSCDSVETFVEMIEQGMNICRINMAHGSQERYVGVIAKIREATAIVDQRQPTQVAIAIDLAGPAARVGMLKAEYDGKIKFARGMKVRFTSKEDYKDTSDMETVYIDQPDFIIKAEVGNKIFIEDGPLNFAVQGKGSHYLDCVVDTEGEMNDNDQCHIPGVLPGKLKLTQKDKDDIGFALHQELDMIFLTLVWSPDQVQNIRRELGIHADAVKVLAKIQNHEGVKKYRDILKVSDGTLVSRGTLGVNLPAEKVFLAQKFMIGQSNRAGKPVVCATQMLQSMTHNPRPTRAEAGDVANAILDGADCLMLSGETARGKHPVHTVQTFVRICREAEAAVFNTNVFRDIRQLTPMPCDTTQTVGISAVQASINCNASAIFLITTTGRSASLISQYRPSCPIIAVTRTPHVARSLHLHRGVFPILHDSEREFDWSKDIDKRFHDAMRITGERDVIKPGDKVVMVTGWLPGSGFTNTIRIMVVPEMDALQPIADFQYTISQAPM